MITYTISNILHSKQHDYYGGVVDYLIFNSSKYQTKYLHSAQLQTNVADRRK